jgi:hypothetical protein
VSLSVELAKCVGLVLLGGSPPLGSVLPKGCGDGVVRRLRLSVIHVTPGILTDQDTDPWNSALAGVCRHQGLPLLMLSIVVCRDPTLITLVYLGIINLRTHTAYLPCCND